MKKMLLSFISENFASIGMYFAYISISVIFYLVCGYDFKTSNGDLHGLHIFAWIYIAGLLLMFVPFSRRGIAILTATASMVEVVLCFCKPVGLFAKEAQEAGFPHPFLLGIFSDGNPNTFVLGIAVLIAIPVVLIVLLDKYEKSKSYAVKIA